jgi:hypothetical protein
MPVSAAWMRNHQRSTSVMCRTRPSGDSREGNRPLLELAGGQAGALEQQRVTVEVQPGFQCRALTQDEPRLGALHLRSRPCLGLERHGHESSDLCPGFGLEHR